MEQPFPLLDDTAHSSRFFLSLHLRVGVYTSATKPSKAFLLKGQSSDPHPAWRIYKDRIGTPDL